MVITFLNSRVAFSNIDSLPSVQKKPPFIVRNLSHRTNRTSETSPAQCLKLNPEFPSLLHQLPPARLLIFQHLQDQNWKRNPHDPYSNLVECRELGKEQHRQPLQLVRLDKCLEEISVFSGRLGFIRIISPKQDIAHNPLIDVEVVVDCRRDDSMDGEGT